MPLAVLKATSGAGPPPPPPTPTGSATLPTVTAEIAFTTNPTGSTVTYTDVSGYLRDVSTQRGRNWEYDRTEAGTATFTLSNRDSRFNPDNTSSPYYPLKPTRRTRLRATWISDTYDLMVGFTKGFPQDFPGGGFDAVVKQRASDLFYRLNMTKFTPGSTTLAAAITTVPDPDTVETIYPVIVGLPMPQAVPFTITIDYEDMQVTEIGASSWTVKRAQNETPATLHAAGAAVTTLSVSFGEALSGTRIRQVLERAGLTTGEMSLDAGISLISASEDLAGQNVLQHLQLIAEAENGRLFASRSGRITFQDRHWSLQNERTDRVVFSDSGAVGTIPYSLPGPVEHDESKIANIVRVTPTSENTQTSSDQTSINENFERVLEKQWPLASDLDAKGATEWMLLNLKNATVRIPELVVKGQANPATLWPLLLDMEIGQRYGFSYTPKGGGDPIAMSVTIEGIQHDVSPGSHTVRLQLSPADTTVYWRLGVPGFSELGVTTRLSY